MERNLTPVPSKVVENVKEYLSKNLPAYTLENVLRKSDHPDDDYLYMVIAKHVDGSYAVWTSWNETSQCLNFGHYALIDVMAAYEVCVEYYFRTKTI